MTQRFNVAGISYNISKKEPEHMQGHIGLADFNAQEIRINSIYSEQTKLIAVYHEIIHIISDAYGLHLSEEQVRVGTHALIAFLAENPNFNIKEILSTL